jgi:hypothetical protein
MERIIAENPVNEPQQVRRTGEGAGPWLRETLEDRLVAWKENVGGFDYAETDRKDGFRIVCPGNLEDGWPDGESHTEVLDQLNDSTIAYVENGYPRFSCRHSHCGEGAAHGKKTWKDLQNYYDPGREFHKLEDETDYDEVFGLEYDESQAEALVESIGVPALTPEEKLVAEAEAIAAKWEAKEKCYRQGCNCGLEHVAAVLEPKPEPEGEFEFATGRNKHGDIFQIIGTLASDVEPEALEWWWQDKVPKGKITLFAGQPDCGKSLAVLDFLARITTGRDFPDGARNTHGAKRVLLAASEDDLANTLIPRLIAAEADLTKVVVLTRVTFDAEGKGKKRRRMLQLADDAKMLKLALRKNPDIAVVALDPISSYFGDADANKDKEIRPVMEAVADACESSKAAFVAVIHNNKRGDADAIGKILGASSIVGVSRAVWGFAKDRDREGEHFMSLVKGNLARNRSGMKYRIVDAAVTIGGKETVQPRTEWIGVSEESADEVLAKSREKLAGGNTKKIDRACRMLEEQLADGPKLLRELYELGVTLGIGETSEAVKKTVQRASRYLGVWTIKPPHAKGPWWASLEEDAEPWNPPEKTFPAEDAL